MPKSEDFIDERLNNLLPNRKAYIGSGSKTIALVENYPLTLKLALTLTLTLTGRQFSLGTIDRIPLAV